MSCLNAASIPSSLELNRKGACNRARAHLVILAHISLLAAILRAREIIASNERELLSGT